MSSNFTWFAVLVEDKLTGIHGTHYVQAIYPSDALEMEEERDTQSLVFGSGALRSSPIYTSTEAKGSPARLPGRLVEPFLEPLRTPLPRSLGRPGPSAACGLEASRGPPGAFEGNRRIGGFCSQNGKIFRQNGS